MKSPAPSPFWKSIRYYYKQALKHNLFNWNWNASPQRSSFTGIYNIEFHEISLTPFAETLPQFPSWLLWRGGGWGWNIGDWVDITHGALHINALWWFKRKCWRQVKDYTNHWCWVLFPPYLTFSVHLCLCLSFFANYSSFVPQSLQLFLNSCR